MLINNCQTVPNLAGNVKVLAARLLRRGALFARRLGKTNIVGEEKEYLLRRVINEPNVCAERKDNACLD